MSWVAAMPAPARAAPDAAAQPPLFAPALVLAAMTEPFLTVIAQTMGQADAGLIGRLFWLPVYAVALPFLVSDWRGMLRAARATPLLVALCMLALVSALWSIAPDVTMRRGFALAVTMLFAWRLATLPWRDLVVASASGLAVLTVASYAFALLWPAAGVMGAGSTHPGAWQGVWSQKNLLGGTMALGAVLFTAASYLDPRRRRMWLGFAFLAVALVVLSRSVTSLVALALSLGVLMAGVLARRDARLAFGIAVTAFALAASVLFILVAMPELALQSIGRDATLTGRTDIWSAANAAIAARPVLGHGYGAFWTVEDGPAYWLRAAIGWKTPNAHNGWLELALALGWTGLALSAAGAACTLWRGAGSLAHRQAGLVAAPFLTLFALLTLSEGYVLQDNNALWALYVAVAAKLALKCCGKESV